MPQQQRDRHVVSGRVQGVGFRPFVYRLALEHGLSGFVMNSPDGVVIEVQGTRRALDGFFGDFAVKLPPLAMIVEHVRGSVPAVAGEKEFSIARSEPGQGHHVLVSPDVATCPECLRDMRDPANRRHGYPFTNCTNCGPRYTITRSLPYDRSGTSMACFPLCPECRKEYDDPLDRRFHAQPNACPACGPSVWFADQQGRELARGGHAMDLTVEALCAGQIMAVKGLGGFHLVADACNPEAVAGLRRRKSRPGKPLAVMVADLDVLARIAAVQPEEARMLCGQERPIVLVRLLKNTALAAEVSPDTDFLGAMLPYTPLHHVLLERFAARSKALPALVMTSGNASSEPISLGNREALSRLDSIADAYLFHDRDILVRTDDSVVRFLEQPGGPGEAPAPRMQFLRRARGFTPSPVFLPVSGPCVLGVGPELKNTICLTKGDQAFVSQHIGDMQNLETAAFHKEVIGHLAAMLQVRPQLVVADLHPDYLATRYALEESGLPVLRLQHHFAHVLAVMASNKLMEPVLGLAMDGSGYGGDGTIWGGEFLYVDPSAMILERAGHLAPVRLPGGEAAIRQPWRMMLAYLEAAGIDTLAQPLPWLAGHEQAAFLVMQMLRKGINSPPTTSCGRLFDAVSALCGVCGQISYEGQAAIRLEHILGTTDSRVYGCPVLPGKPAVLDTLELFRQAFHDVCSGVCASVVSARVHKGLAKGLAEMARMLCTDLGIRSVALSGGVFLNATLAGLVPRLLLDAGITVYTHKHEPPGDGCISLGQAFYGGLVKT